MKLQDQMRQYIEVIRSFLEYDVDIDVCDADLIRIVGTGRYSSGIGRKMIHGKLSELAIGEKRDVFILDPNREEPCASCEYRSYCGRYPRMVFPLIGDGVVHGAVSVTALDPEQGRDLLRRKDKFIPFMHAVRDLMVLKVGELEAERREAHSANLQRGLLDSIRDGAMLLDARGRIVSLNKRGESILGCTLRQIGQLARDGRFAMAFAGARDGEAEYRVRIHRTKMRLVGATTVVDGGHPSLNHRIFVFSDIRVLRDEPRSHDDPALCTFDSMIGRSPAFREAVAACRRVAFHPTPVLLSGEVASGKEVFARAMHNEGLFRDNRFIRVAHGAELQGFLDRNAPDRDRRNSNDFVFLAEKVDGNTFYMDEIGDFALEDQCIVLAMIQNSGRLNTRVICGTAKDLEPLVETGEFHPELFYSLEVYAIAVPPVRAREDDVLLFAAHYLEIANGRLHRNVLLSKEVLAMFQVYPWRGNVREIENTIAYLVEHSEVDDVEITPELLPPALRKKFAERRKRDYNLERAEKQLIVSALNDFALSRAPRARVAEALGISNATLYRKLRQYGVKQATQYD